MPPNPDVLDGVGQLLLIKDLRPSLELIYHTDWSYADFVKFINRAKDELVTPDDFDLFVARERAIFEDRYGSYADASARLITNGNLRPVRDVRSDYARLRRNERQEELGKEIEYDADARREGGRPRGAPDDRRHGRALRAAVRPGAPSGDRCAGRHLRAGRRGAGGDAAGRDRIGLPRLPGGAGEAGRARLRRADRRGHAAVQGTARTSCADGSASSATSWSTSSRTPTRTSTTPASPTSSASSCPRRSQPIYYLNREPAQHEGHPRLRRALLLAR